MTVLNNTSVNSILYHTERKWQKLSIRQYLGHVNIITYLNSESAKGRKAVRRFPDYLYETRKDSLPFINSANHLQFYKISIKTRPTLNALNPS
ncbi:hypothetical protein RCL_jg10948.t1 [Rhizophagus clarus]|uniref:Uncharacterized protein n=1 Tax=Rhizophagus clarus TaxID=94130 RepID=A0A8H3L4R2_9GLOM|nr:hypothetical protein RCL_jg10948.t1 [Rhizophagus clarus]